MLGTPFSPNGIARAAEILFMGHLVVSASTRNDHSAHLYVTMWGDDPQCRLGAVGPGAPWHSWCRIQGEAMKPMVPSPIPSHPSEFACIDLINSAFTDHLGKGPGYDRLGLPEWRAWFLTRYGLEVIPSHPVPIKELAALRDQMRTLLEKWATTGLVRTHDADVLNRWVGRAQLRQRVTRVSGQLELTIEPTTPDWNSVMARIAASAVELLASSPPERLKVCANPDCSWMFYDHTLNRSKQYCSTDRCGNVLRVRHFRRRTGVS
jgi:predicted RNA-binding Zn ribbon-like protein